MMMEKSNFLVLFLACFLAMFGGSVRYLNMVDKKKFSIYTFVIQVITSAFIGIVLGLLCTYFGWTSTLTWAVSGIGGASGYAIIEKLHDKILGKVIDKI